jgi:hypothetical protein
MGNGFIGKIIYYWIFILGILFMARIFGFADSGGTMIMALVVGTLIYVGLQLIRFGSRKE